LDALVRFVAPRLPCNIGQADFIVVTNFGDARWPNDP
jgi:hypothetical protein